MALHRSFRASRLALLVLTGGIFVAAGDRALGADCNTNGTNDNLDLAETGLGAAVGTNGAVGAPSNWVGYASSPVGIVSDVNTNSQVACDDFVLTSATTITALDVDGRNGNGSSETFRVKIWSSYSFTDSNGDGMFDAGTFHPLNIIYAEDVPAIRVTFIATPTNPPPPNPSPIFRRWHIKLASPVTLSGSSTGTTYFVEIGYTGNGTHPWQWESAGTNNVGASTGHITQIRYTGNPNLITPEGWLSQSPATSSSMRFKLYTARSVDANSNRTPDECEDCNTNGIPDFREGLPDCNSNGIPDTCDLKFGIASDCNSNGKPDECDFAYPDGYLAGKPSTFKQFYGDCNTNGVLDPCDVAAGAGDCNTNGIPDVCEMSGAAAPAFDQFMGGFPGVGYPADNNINNHASTGTVAERFTLTKPTPIASISIAGKFSNGTGGSGDEFHLNIWTVNAAGLPGTVIHSEDITGGNVTRTAYQPTVFTGFWKYNCRLAQTLLMPTGTYFLDIYYTNPTAFQDFQWASLEPRLPGTGSLTVSLNAMPETWVTPGSPSRMTETLYRGVRDCNTNGVMDDCELAGNDANHNAIPDVCEDCNTNGVPDPAESDYVDCNTNLTADACELAANATLDCNTDNTLDACELVDCNTNGRIDACEMASGTAPDCDTNQAPDICAPDCNTNGRPDACDIASGTAHDCNADGVPDICDTSLQTNVAYTQAGTNASNTGFFSDVTRASPQVCADDFTLATPTAIPSVSLLGFFNGTGAGDGVTDTFTLRFWTNAGARPGTVEYTEDVPAARVNLDIVSGFFRYFLRLSHPVMLSAGTHWVEIYYTGPASSDFVWYAPIGGIGADARVANVAPGENWTGDAGSFYHLAFTLFTAQPDCDTNSIPDSCETAGDSNSNGVPDVCEDCNSNGTPDIFEPGYTDCNTNSTADLCDRLTGRNADCNTDTTLDVCQLVDCNTNGSLDLCDVTHGSAADCDTNHIPDECEADCNSNNRPDICDVRFGAPDCNNNGYPDVCDIAGTVLRYQQYSGIAAADFFSDSALHFPDGNGPQVLADDFTLATATSLGAVMIHGGFVNGTSNPEQDQFTVVIWTNSGGQPGAVEFTDTVAYPRVQRPSNGDFLIHLNSTANLSAGTHWLEVYYTGSGAGDFYWEDRGMNAAVGSNLHIALSLPEPPWIDPGPGFVSSLKFRLFSGSNDTNTNGIPDECESVSCSCRGDVTGDSKIDGQDVGGFVRCLLGAGLPTDHCGCADIAPVGAPDGVINGADVTAFVSKLLSETSTACP